MPTWRQVLTFFDTRKRAYSLCFPRNQIHTKFALKDLAKFCRAYESCWGSTERDHARLEGRREVWLRIVNHLDLSADELAELYSGLRKPMSYEEEVSV